MVIDLHVHTTPLSNCSVMEPAEAIDQAKQLGLDGICFTEHNRIWDADAIAELRKEHDFLVLRGMEINTVEGHVLSFGIYKDITSLISITELQHLVNPGEKVLIAAHPFRDSILSDSSILGLTVEQGSQKSLLQQLDIVEAYSGWMTDRQIEFTVEVSKKLNLRIVGGSDAHHAREMGRCVTYFERDIHNETELLRELKAGRYTAGYFRR